MTKLNQYFKKVIYTNTYLDQTKQMDKSEVDKLEQAVIVHGYRGASKKKTNGVVPIRDSDSQLWKALKKFKEYEIELLKTVVEEFVIDVKLVAHITNGNRAIGSLYKDTDGEFVLYVLGFCNYNYQLF